MSAFLRPFTLRARYRSIIPQVALLVGVAFNIGCPSGMRKPPKLPMKPPALPTAPGPVQPPKLEINDKPDAISPRNQDPKPPVELIANEANRRVTTPLMNHEPPADPNGPQPLPKPTAEETKKDTEVKKDADLEKIRDFHKKAAAKYDGIEDYTARFRRREFAAGKQQPEDLMELKFKKPFMVHFKFLSGSSSEGRELLYVEGQNKGRMTVLTGKGDPFSGITLNEEPDSARAVANSRRTIKDAGIGNVVDKYGRVVKDQEKGGAKFGTLQYIGPQKRPESETPMECVVQQLPGGVEPLLPKGATRYWFFNADPKAQECGLPTLVITTDEAKREVEYYCYDRLQVNMNMKAEEFDPANAFKKK